MIPTADGGIVPTPAVELSIDPAATPSPIGDVRQPPYAESECSDKYPCEDDVEGWESRIRVPEGFAASYYARIDGQPNVLTFGPDGLLYVGTMAGEIFRVDEGGAPELHVDGFLAPAGLAFQPGTERLYVASRLVDLNEGGEARVAMVEDGVVTDVITGLPCCYVSMHSANGIAFGPDGYGYVAVGARADHGEILSGPNASEQDELHPYEASILRFSPDGAYVETYARGLRNSFDIAWDADGNLFAADNMPDFGPPEEFNKIVPGGEHGYPWYDCDACFAAPDDVDIVPPIHTFVAHSAPTGVVSYLDDDFPGYYNSLFLTLWSAFPEAQRVVWLGPGGEETATFATGFAAPIDLTVGPDGALYVADWATGIIFRIEYVGA
jgi:glucose/arabinose dehydrogenase